MKLLITGGCGLVGTHLAKFYQNEDFVLVVDNFERSELLGHKNSNIDRTFYNQQFLKKKIGTEIVSLDISTKQAWDTIEERYGKFDVIFHMAAFVGVGASYKLPLRAIEINTMGTALMLEKARKWKAKVVYPSTFKVYAINEGWKCENERWRWADPEWHANGYPVGAFGDGARSPYGAAKYAGELLCQEYAKTYEVPIGIFRMSNIYGEHQISFEEQGWLTWFIISNIKHYPINIFGDGCQVRDLLYASDLVKAFDKFIQSSINFGIWNIGGGPKNTLTLNEGIDLIEAETDTLFSYINYDEWRKSDLKVYTSDISKIKNDLNWSPSVSLKDGVKRVCKWIKTTEMMW